MLAELSKGIVARYQIEPRNVVAHSDIAPQRKDDPGPLFPWQQMAERGIGAWPDAARVSHFLAGRNPQQPVDQAHLLNLLKQYGYTVTENMTPEQAHRVISAFQMHFRQSDYRGNADAQSEAIVLALLQQFPDSNN